MSEIPPPSAAGADAPSPPARAHAGVFLKGALMGAANVVPGVSGGTMAFITGIYERLIGALRAFDASAARALLRGDLRAFARHVDLVFLVVLGLGVLASILTVAKILGYGLEHFPEFVAAGFFGLILASVLSVGRMVGSWGAGGVGLALFGAAGAAVLAFVTPAGEDAGVVYLGLCGVAAMCSMIIPGLSGSFVLLLMGNYQLVMIDSVNALSRFELGAALPVLVPVGIGAVVGLFALARVLNWLFTRHYDLAVAVITGFIAGSLLTIWPWKHVVPLLGVDGQPVTKDGEPVVAGYEWYLPDLGAGETWVALALVAAGAAAVFAVERMAGRPAGKQV